jgi:hypothetical protein
MTIFKRLGAVLLGGMIVIFVTEIAARLPILGMSGFVSTAEAVVGRPLTPVSVAGAARRTVRRCAAGVYYC